MVGVSALELCKIGDDMIVQETDKVRIDTYFELLNQVFRSTKKRRISLRALPSPPRPMLTIASVTTRRCRQSRMVS